MYNLDSTIINMILQSDPIEEVIRHLHSLIDNETAKPLCEMDCDLIDENVNAIIELYEWKDE